MAAERYLPQSPRPAAADPVADDIALAACRGDAQAEPIQVRIPDCVTDRAGGARINSALCELRHAIVIRADHFASRSSPGHHETRKPPETPGNSICGDRSNLNSFGHVRNGQETTGKGGIQTSKLMTRVRFPSP